MTAPPDLAALLGAPDGRRALAAASPAFFDSYYCGMRSAPHRSRWLATLVETIEATIATAADAAYLDRLVGRIDKLADEGRLTSEQVQQLTGRIDSRREQFSPAQPVGSAG